MKVKVKAWEYYRNRGYYYLFNTSLEGSHISVNYCHEEPGQNPETRYVGSFRVYGYQTTEDIKANMKVCAKMAHNHMEENT